MAALKGFQKKHMRGLAHNLKPVVQVGKDGMTEGVCRAVDEALLQHELIKVKFIDFKDKDQKEALSCEIEVKTGSERIGMIGHTVILFRQHVDPEKRKIAVPHRKKPFDLPVSRQ